LITRRERIDNERRSIMGREFNNRGRGLITGEEIDNREERINNEKGN
jgi:hypothetical protein